ncbi:hypothetical protein Tco_0593703 [Tanacetum coccineum]
MVNCSSFFFVMSQVIIFLHENIELPKQSTPTTNSTPPLTQKTQLIMMRRKIGFDFGCACCCGGGSGGIRRRHRFAAVVSGFRSIKNLRLHPIAATVQFDKKTSKSDGKMQTDSREIRTEVDEEQQTNTNSAAERSEQNSAAERSEQR